MAQQDHRMALPQGTRVQDFEFHRVLGHGGFGITYLGWNVTLDIAVAIKEYLPADLGVREQDLSVAPRSSGDEADFQWGLDRFLDEARVMARFKHNNIIQVQHFFEAHGTAYIVMEYAEGETLASLLKRRGTLAEEELQAILLPLLSGLAAVHEAGILHRDIKPGNIMLRAQDGSPVLVDFGAARQAVGARSRSMTAIVTPGYAPIEQYSSRGRQGPWTDIYALGGVCYRALTGELPAEATDRVRSDPLIPIAEAGRDKAKEEFLRAVDWALRVDEGDRPQQAGEWRTALLGEREVPAAAAVSMKSEDRPEATSAARSGLFGWALGLALTLLVGAGGWWGWQVYEEGGGGTVYEAVKAVLPGLGEAQPEARAEAESKPAPPVEEDEVTRLLAAAEADLAALRLTSPAGNNAWEKYQRVLELAPAHPQAMAGMERVIESYMELFGAAVEQEEFVKASGYLERIRGLHPDSPVLEGGERRLATAKQARVDRLALRQAIREHMDSFEAALEAEDFDEAAGSLERIRALRADAPELAEGERRLAEARKAEAERLAELARQRQAEAVRQAELFEEALRGGDFDRAAGHLARVRELHPRAPVLVEGEQRLAEARQAEVERQRKEAEARARELAGEMVLIPGGMFRMGDLRGETTYDNSAKPVHTVALRPFQMGKHEVTFAQWDACMADGGCGAYLPDDEGWGRGNRPVMSVSWYDAQAFIDWLNSKTDGGYRLPTEAEWEYAARSGSTTSFHFGDDRSQLCRYANHADASFDEEGRSKACSDGIGEGTAEVGRYQPNAFGLYDMLGNVWEWVADCWNKNYRGAPSDGSAWTSGECDSRVIRGGSWDNPVWGSDHRSLRLVSSRYNHIGFRLVRVVQD